MYSDYIAKLVLHSKDIGLKSASFSMKIFRTGNLKTLIRISEYGFIQSPIWPVLK